MGRTRVSPGMHCRHRIDSTGILGWHPLDRSGTADWLHNFVNGGRITQHRGGVRH